MNEPWHWSLSWPCVRDAERNPPRCLPPTQGASYSWDESRRSEFFQSNAETLRLNVCMPAPDRETPHFLNTAAHPTMRSKRALPSPTDDPAPQIFPVQMSQAPANNPIRIRSCLCPSHFPYKSGTPAAVRRATPTASIPLAYPGTSVSFL